MPQSLLSRINSGNHQRAGLLLILLGVFSVPVLLLQGVYGVAANSRMPDFIAIMWVVPIIVGFGLIAKQKWAAWLAIVLFAVLMVWCLSVINIFEVATNGDEYLDILFNRSQETVNTAPTYSSVKVPKDLVN